ncbi:hypothetical protein [Aeromicrobium sp.]|uniref:hypothetical protein n=1 Tax=Aeromicrobium sp. TaxID=1871063 RepID=UPI0030BBE513
MIASSSHCPAISGSPCLVVLVGPDDVVKAAQEMSKALGDYGYGHIESVEANQVRDEFVSAARKALGLT